MKTRHEGIFQKILTLELFSKKGTSRLLYPMKSWESCHSMTKLQGAFVMTQRCLRQESRDSQDISRDSQDIYQVKNRLITPAGMIISLF